MMSDMRAFMRGTSSPRPMFKPVRVMHTSVRVAQSRQASVKAQAFFNFFQAKPSAPSGPDPRGKALAEDLAGLCAGTDYGSKANAERKEAIAMKVSLVFMSINAR